jgi:hypothetical protein
VWFCAQHSLQDSREKLRRTTRSLLGMYVYVCMHACMYIMPCTLIYIYIYIYTHTHTHITCRFIKEWGFQRAGVFSYSDEEGTPAALMHNQVYVCMYVHVYLYTHTDICIYVYIYRYVCVFMCACVCTKVSPEHKHLKSQVLSTI